MKVLFIHSSDTDGATKTLVESIESFGPKIEAKILMPKGQVALKNYLRSLGYQVQSIPLAHPKLFIFPFLWGLIALIRQVLLFKPDLMHLTCHRLVHAVGAVSQILLVPLVIRLHRPEPLGMFEKSLRNAYWIGSFSQCLEKIPARLRGHGKLIFEPYHTHEVDFAQAKKRLRERYGLLGHVKMFSVMMESKEEARVLLEAMRLRPWPRGSYAIFASSALEEEEKRWVELRFAELRMDGVWIWRSEVEDPFFIAAMDAVLILFQGQHWDYAPLVPMAMGIPVIAARQSSIRDFVIHDRTGLTFTPEEPSSLAYQLEKLLHSEVLVRHLSSYSKSFVRENFSGKKQAWDLTALYAKLVGEADLWQARVSR